MAVRPRPLADQWRGLPYETVRDLAADKLTEHEGKFVDLGEELRSMKRVLFGILVSVATASILLALNLVVGKGVGS